MKQLILFFLAFTLFTSVTYAQGEVYSSTGKPLNKSQKDVKSDRLIDPDRLIIGGWGVFGIGSGVTNIGITPILGYRITDNFSAGIGFGYQYFRFKNYFVYATEIDSFGYPVSFDTANLNAHFYSPSVWMRYLIWNNIFAHTEYEQNISTYREYYNNTLANPPYETRKITVSVPSLLLGGGIRQPVGRRSSIVAMVLYDVIQDERSPYYQTVAIRLGFNFGF